MKFRRFGLSDLINGFMTPAKAVTGWRFLTGLHQFTNAKALQIWVAGCGTGQIQLWAGRFGQSLTLCDISKNCCSRHKQTLQGKLGWPVLSCLLFNIIRRSAGFEAWCSLSCCLEWLAYTV